MPKKIVSFFCVFIFLFLFVSEGAWLPTDVRLNTGDTAGANYSYSPQISSAGSNVYCVWHGYRNGDSHN